MDARSEGLDDLKIEPADHFSKENEQAFLEALSRTLGARWTASEEGTVFDGFIPLQILDTKARDEYAG